MITDKEVKKKLEYDKYKYHVHFRTWGYKTLFMLNSAETKI